MEQRGQPSRRRVGSGFGPFIGKGGPDDRDFDDYEMPMYNNEYVAGRISGGLESNGYHPNGIERKVHTPPLVRNVRNTCIGRVFGAGVAGGRRQGFCSISVTLALLSVLACVFLIAPKIGSSASARIADMRYAMAVASSKLCVLGIPVNSRF